MRKSLHSKQQTLLLHLLKEARLAAGFTQADVAARLGRPQSFVAKYENGERRLDVVEFLALVRVLRSDPVRIIRAIAVGSRRDVTDL
jgi:transcriptional regulator with XRE-family HTH domain